MKKIKKIVSYVIIIASIGRLNADNRIIAYMKQAPDKAITQAIEQLRKDTIEEKIKKLNKKTPGELSIKMVKNEIRKYLIPKQSGFLALYAGYSDYSNSDGLIHFPLRHVESKLYLIITKKIKLEKVKGNTISQLEFSTAKNNDKKIYLFEKQQDKNKQYFWRVSEEKNYKEKRINPISVVILTSPKNIYIPTGDFMTDASKHLILPSIYVVGNVDNNQIILNTLNMKHYFEPIDENEQKATDTIIKKILNNM